MPKPTLTSPMHALLDALEGVALVSDRVTSEEAAESLDRERKRIRAAILALAGVV